MTVDNPDDAEQIYPLGIPQGSFEERLRVASERRAKVLALKAAQESISSEERPDEEGVVPIRVRKYIRSGPGAHDGTRRLPENSITQETPLLLSPAERSEDAIAKNHPGGFAKVSPFPPLADDSKEVLPELQPRKRRGWAYSTMFVFSFMMGATAGCLGTLLWSGVITLPIQL